MNNTEQKAVKISVSVREFAKMTGIGINRVREMCYIEGFPAYKIGNRTETCGNYLTKGRKVAIEGRLSVRKYEKPTRA